MSPKPEGIILPPANVPISETPELIHSSEKKEGGVVKRLPEFERFENPFGVVLHRFTLFLLGHAHIFAIYAFYLMFSGKAPWSTLAIDILFGHIAGLGITVGCHRYWTHKTFKASKPLQVLLMLMQTLALQFPIHKWCLDHRIHHKYTDTNADPHNSERGLLFSHVTWMFYKRHPDYQKKFETFEVPDLEKDPIVRFQSRWYWTLVAIFHTIIPVAVIYYIFGLPLLYCVAINYRRYVLTLHATWCVNSFAHKFGDKPYDKSISSVDTPIVAFVSIGEGWHNYHHTFPWDYKAAELGWKINMSTMFIDLCAKLGHASDLKTVSQKMLKDRLRRTGDGSHADSNIEENCSKEDFDYKVPANVTKLMSSLEHPIWGWDDEKIPDDFRQMTKILSPGGK